MKNLAMVVRALLDMMPVLYSAYGLTFPLHLVRCALSVGGG